MKNIVIFLFCLTSCKAQTSLTTYTVSAGSTYATPSIQRPAKDTVKFWFRLNADWSQLYLSHDNSTHKICGVSDLLGRNSLRLGVRRATTQRNGLVAVPYTHKSGKIDYTAFKDSLGHSVFISYDSLYYCKVYKVATGWRIDLLDARLSMLCSAVKPIYVSLIGRYVSGTYIEVGSSPSPWTIHTEIEVK